MFADLSASGGSKVTDDFAAWRLIFNTLKQEGKVVTNSQSKLITTYHMVRARIFIVVTNTPAESPVKKPTTKFGSPDACMTAVIDVVSTVTLIRAFEVKISMQPCFVIASSGVGHCLFKLIVLP